MTTARLTYVCDPCDLRWPVRSSVAGGAHRLIGDEAIVRQLPAGDDDPPIACPACGGPLEAELPDGTSTRRDPLR